MIGYLPYKIGEFVTQSVPWKIAYKIGIFFAKLHFFVSKKDKEAVMNNLRVILPKENDVVIRKKAKDVFINFGLYLVEFFRFSMIDRKYVESHFSIVGRENLDKAKEDGKGAILLTAHIGNWELAGMALSLLGYKLMVIALDHKNPKIKDFFDKRRLSKGIEVVSLGASIKRCYRGLRNNKFVAILGDRDFSRTGYSLDFLGRKKKIPRGPAVLALRTGAPIIPVLVTRQGLDRLEVECFSPIEISKETDEIELMKKYLKIIEDRIYKIPSQWLMFREFWKE